MKVLGIDTESDVPRSEATPLTEAGRVLREVAAYFGETGIDDAEDYVAALLMDFYDVGPHSAYDFGGMATAEDKKVSAHLDSLKDAIARHSVSPDYGIPCAQWAIAFVADALHAHESNDIAAAWTYVLEAVFAAAGAKAAQVGVVYAEGLAQFRASSGGRARRANDPKAAAKAEALGLWMERHAGKHPKLGTVEQYATEVMRRWPVLESSKVICGWSAKWTKAVQKGETPAC